MSFSPQVGREQAGYRPALVISPQAYNQISHFVLACPITNTIKGWSFEVVLPQTMQTSGVILTDQIAYWTGGREKRNLSKKQSFLLLNKLWLKFLR